MPSSFRAIEIGAVTYVKTQEEGVPYFGAAAYIGRFLEFFLREEHFSRLAWLDAPGGLLRMMTTDRAGPCRIVSSLREAVRSKPELQRACLRGLQVLFLLHRLPSEVVDFCGIAEYRVTTRSRLGSGQAGDPVGLFPDRTQFTQCLIALDAKPNQTIAVFSHDGDPLYLIERA